MLCFVACLQQSLVTWLATNFVLKFAVGNDPFASAGDGNLLVYKKFSFAFRRREGPGQRMQMSSSLER